MSVCDDVCGDGVAQTPKTLASDIFGKNKRLGNLEAVNSQVWYWTHPGFCAHFKYDWRLEDNNDQIFLKQLNDKLSRGLSWAFDDIR